MSVVRNHLKCQVHSVELTAAFSVYACLCAGAQLATMRTSTRALKQMKWCSSHEQNAARCCCQGIYFTISKQYRSGGGIERLWSIGSASEAYAYNVVCDVLGACSGNGLQSRLPAWQHQCSDRNNKQTYAAPCNSMCLNGGLELHGCVGHALGCVDAPQAVNHSKCSFAQAPKH
jgi:hypothetical protein